MSNLRDYEIERRQVVLDAINNSRRALNVSDIASKCQLRWTTAKKYAVDLEHQGLIKEVKQVTRVRYEKLGEQA